MPLAYFGVDQRLDRAGAPAGLFQDLTGRCFGRCLTLLDQAHGQLPRPGVRDEAVPPHHQDLAPLIDHGGHGQVPELHDMVLPAVPVRRLDVGEPQVHPAVLVDRTFPVDLPLHRCGPSRSTTSIAEPG